MTKAEIELLINTKIADGSDITASEHREVEQSFVNEIYASAINDDETFTNIWESITTDFEYKLSTKKTGNTVNVLGFLKNISGTILTFTPFLKLLDSTFTPLHSFFGTTPPLFVLTLCSNGVSTVFSLKSGNDYYLAISNIGVNEEVIFNLTYITID